MAKITELSIQEKNKSRVNLFLDGEFYRGVSLEIVYKFSLKVDKEITKERLEEIITLAEEDEALNKALNYLTKYSKTQKQLIDYLVKKEYPFRVIYKVIDKLKEYNYINDVDYAKKYIEFNSGKQGRRLLERNLRLKGVNQADIENAFINTELNAEETADKLAIKHIKNKERTLVNLQKTYKYLISKGFSYEEASRAISKLKE